MSTALAANGLEMTIVTRLGSPENGVVGKS